MSGAEKRDRFPALDRCGAFPVWGEREYHGENPCLPAWAMRELCRRIAERRIAADRKGEGI
jgi:hypothetical protein